MAGYRDFGIEILAGRIAGLVKDRIKFRIEATGRLAGEVEPFRSNAMGILERGVLERKGFIMEVEPGAYVWTTAAEAYVLSHLKNRGDN